MDIYEEFTRKFSIKIAQTQLERQEAYSLRHRVFREELSYNLGINREAPLEFDIHDRNSILCIVTHNQTGLTAGCMRLVATDEEKTSSCRLLPIEHICHQELKETSFHPDNYDRNEICEISRLAVPKEFRKLKNIDDFDSDTDSKICTIHKYQSHLLPIIGISLFLAATAIVGISGRRHVFAMMEKRFARLLGISGIRFHPAGSPVDYHGERIPFYIDQLDAERSMKPKLKKLYHSIKADLTHQQEQHQKVKRYLTCGDPPR